MFASHARLWLIVIVACLVAGPVQGLEPDWVDAHRDRLGALLDALNLDYPGLESVKQSVEAGEMLPALEALIAYYEQKDVSGAPFLTNAQEDNPLNLNIPKEILDDRFFIQGILATQRRRDDGGIDWQYLGPREDREWAWMMNRHLYFYQLVFAWRETGDIEYIQKLDTILRDWVLANPSPRRLNFDAAWRALEAARRILDSWTWSFYTLQDEPAFSGEARLLLLSSLPDHGEMLKEHPSFWGGNHLLTEKIGLGQLAVAFPEFKSAPDWLSRSLEMVKDNILKQSYPDGGYKELTFHYHRIVAENLMLFLRLLEFGGVEADMERELFQRGSRMWDYMLKVVRPNGFGPLNSDSDYEGVLSSRYLKLIGPEAPPAWKHIVSGGKEGRIPRESPTQFWEWSGHVVFRDHWRQDGQWAFFDVGPYGSAHYHQDRLHLSVTLGREDFLVDTGRYHYKAGPLRDYFQGPKGHNLILLNGEGTLQEAKVIHKPLNIDFRSSPQYTWVSALAPYAGSAGSHRRSVFYRPGKYWIVLDEIRTFGPRELEAIWHLHPERVLEKTSNAGLRLLGEVSVLDVKPLLIGSWDMQSRKGILVPEPRGWYSPNFNEREPAEQITFLNRGSGPTTLAWVLIPSAVRDLRDPLEADSRIEVLGMGGGLLHLSIELPRGLRERVELSSDGVRTFSAF